jgi:Mg2+-importing ATPase
VLVVTSLGGLALALLVSLTPIGSAIGFGHLQPLVLLGIGAISLAYLVAAEALKRFGLDGGALPRFRGRARQRPGTARP